MSEDGEARLTAMFRAHVGQVRAFARRRVGSDAAEEVVSQTFLAAWRHIDAVPAPALPWLYRTASLEIANLRRRQQTALRFRVALDVDPPIPDVTADVAGSSVERMAVSLAFGQLPERDQEVLRLTVWEHLSAADAATTLGCSEVAFRVRLHRARRRLAGIANGLTTGAPSDEAKPASTCGAAAVQPKTTHPEVGP